MKSAMGETRQEVYRFGSHDYQVGRTYTYKELPKEVRKDLSAQVDEIESRYGRDPKTLHYRLVMVPYPELVRQLQDRLGARYERLLRDPQIAALAQDIEHHGLKSPPVLEEGLKRAMALASLRWDMPYFTIDEPIAMPSPEFIPTLDGRWLNGRYPLGR